MTNLYRPRYHFTPKNGWMNDPNGLICINGMYHLFYQHNPYACRWDHMHWGHAISRDLVRWEHLPIAIAPDESGDIFSGSCVFDTENRSGLGSKENPPLLAFYTSHNMDTGREMQCVAYSTDFLNFTKYPDNPIIPPIPSTSVDGRKNRTPGLLLDLNSQNAEYHPARDPFVFRNPVTGAFSMCLTTEKDVRFYSSENLLNWQESGSFSLPPYAFQGMIECPCMFFAMEEGVKKAALILSMDVPKEEYAKFPEDVTPHSRLIQYFIGDFDGQKFLPDASLTHALLLDRGRDFYAGNLFAGTDFPVLMAWLGNSAESMQIPTEEEGFRGIMSYPRKLEIIQTSEGYRIRQSFYPAPDPETEGIKKTEDGVIFRDGCVTEKISKDGLISETYME